MACAFHATLAANKCVFSFRRFSLKHPKTSKRRFDLFTVRVDSDDSVCFACDTWNTPAASSAAESTNCDGIPWFSSWKHLRESKMTSRWKLSDTKFSSKGASRCFCLGKILFGRTRLGTWSKASVVGDGGSPVESQSRLDPPPSSHIIQYIHYGCE